MEKGQTLIGVALRKGREEHVARAVVVYGAAADVKHHAVPTECGGAVELESIVQNVDAGHQGDVVARKKLESLGVIAGIERPGAGNPKTRRRPTSKVGRFPRGSDIYGRDTLICVASGGRPTVSYPPTTLTASAISVM